jgi:hypothetical protein
VLRVVKVVPSLDGQARETIGVGVTVEEVVEEAAEEGTDVVVLAKAVVVIIVAVIIVVLLTPAVAVAEFVVVELI